MNKRINPLGEIFRRKIASHASQEDIARYKNEWHDYSCYRYHAGKQRIMIVANEWDTIVDWDQHLLQKIPTCGNKDCKNMQHVHTERQLQQKYNLP